MLTHSSRTRIIRCQSKMRMAKFGQLHRQIPRSTVQITSDIIPIYAHLPSSAWHQLPQTVGTCMTASQRIIPALLHDHRIKQPNRQTVPASSLYHQRIIHPSPLLAGRTNNPRNRVGPGTAIADRRQARIDHLRGQRSPTAPHPSRYTDGRRPHKRQGIHLSNTRRVGESQNKARISNILIRNNFRIETIHHRCPDRCHRPRILTKHKPGRTLPRTKIQNLSASASANRTLRRQRAEHCAYADHYGYENFPSHKHNRKPDWAIVNPRLLQPLRVVTP